MSTRPDATPETRRTNPRIDEPTDFSRPEPTTTTGSESPPTDVSWTALCQQQFDTTDSGRLKNLTDDENEAMHDGL
ncbi:hypothetical protein [Haloarchaeobius amylolyticus]|uniref:hypothetical protein n=1 Tax=Haloarchaeobius amylolyticus TaxID=1198296 RepID=UPI002271FE87|nr:hypothetical protein [Haloarchaeobius amylolyticus]